MIRIVLFLAALGLIAFGFAWFADRPGDVAITWLGYRIETSLMVAALVVALVAIAAIFLWSILRVILGAPEQVSLLLRHRRALRGYLAVSRGLIAIGAGDLIVAGKAAAEAGRLSPGDPLALLLSAQSAQMAGDRAGAERAFRAMLDKPETKLLGLRGLYVEAQRRNDPAAARLYAEQAARSAHAPAWAGQAVLDHRCAAADWAGALAALEAMKSALDKPDYRRKRAVLLAARAIALQDSDRDTSLTLVLEAVKLAPDLVPAAALAGRRLAEAGNPRKARKILEAAWAASPHPDLAASYADLRPGDSARERLNRVRKLTEKTPATRDSALALAQAALDARDFAAARAALTPYLPMPTRRVAALMADIEQAEHGDVGRAREWMARAVNAAPDPAWTADGVVSERWLPVSPVSGVLDAFRWKVPLAEIGVERPVIDVAQFAVPPAPEAPAAIDAVPAPVAPAAPRASRPARRTEKPAAEPVIPLVHAPDDPGPELAVDDDPAAEMTPPPPDPWQRIKQLFR